MVSKSEDGWKAEFCTATGLSFSKMFKIKLDATNYERYLEKTFGCEKTEVKEMLKRDYKPFIINGCKVKPAKTGQRCFGLKMNCPHYGECLTAIAKKDWYGWKVIDIVEEEGGEKD